MTMHEEVLDDLKLEAALREFETLPDNFHWVPLSDLLPKDDGLPHLWKVGKWRVKVSPSSPGLAPSRLVTITATDADC